MYRIEKKCIVVMLRPSSTTPFPYTTLFRSDRLDQPVEDRRPVGKPVVQAHRLDAQRPAELAHAQPLDAVGVDDLQRGGDRKSTRLNSSHPSKSYAVFRLKKKILYNITFFFL